MGACFGRCLNAAADHFFHRSYLRQTNVFVDEDDQLEFGQSSNSVTNHSRSPKNGLLSLFSLKKFKQTNTAPIVLELIEDTPLPGQCSTYKKLNNKNASIKSGIDNPLLVLDASGLIINQECASFTPTSSIDLEWENEGMPTPANGNEKLQNLDESFSEPTVNNSQHSSLTASPWSQVSTPNSLEWDPVEADNEDFETDELLTEIERLTNRALEETAEWVKSG